MVIKHKDNMIQVLMNILYYIWHVILSWKDLKIIIDYSIIMHNFNIV